MAEESGLLSRLNCQQRESVVAGWGPMLVLAGAGSGKTTVLTRRIAYLILNLRQDPSSVLAVTFTNKAANEMKHRLERLVGHSLARQLWIGTFHSVCARILRKEIEAYSTPEGFKWQSNFVIYDQADSLALAKAAITRLNLDDKAFPARDVLNRISTLKNEGYTASQAGSQAKSYKEIRTAEIYSSYQADLARNNALDFDDLILTFTHLLKQNPGVLQRQKEQFRHLLVDEFQDTNQSQYQLVRLLSADQTTDWNQRSLMVVGDVDQSIYSWRQADFRIILGFQKDFSGSNLVKLEENYRSTKTILDVANSIIVNNSERLDKVLRPNRNPGAKVKCFTAVDEIDEAYCVVEELKRLQSGGRSLSDCAFLYRTNSQSRAIEEVLVRNNLPYTMVGSTRFYDRAEVKDVLAYLKLIYNEHDSQAFLRIVNTPRRGLGKTTLDRLAGFASQHFISLLRAASDNFSIPDISQRNSKTLTNFAQMVSRWKALSQAISVSAILEVVLTETGYLAELEKDSAADPQALGMAENVKELIAVAREFESIADEPSLGSFLTRISLISDLDTAQLDQDAVKLMTLHSAKGLEFPVVFLMGLEEGLFPHSRSFNSPTALEEERRLMYVGVTRAQDILYLSYARKRMMFAGAQGSSNYTIASRFLNEIDANLLVGYYPEPAPVTNAPWQDNWAYQPARPSTNVDSTRQGKPSIQPWTGSLKLRHASDLLAAAPNLPSPSVDRSANKFMEWTRLKVGNVVQHSKFGVGTVIQIIGDNDKELYNVEFDSAGKRLLDPRFAKLVKLN